MLKLSLLLLLALIYLSLASAQSSNCGSASNAVLSSEEDLETLELEEAEGLSVGSVPTANSYITSSTVGSVVIQVGSTTTGSSNACKKNSIPNIGTQTGEISCDVHCSRDFSKCPLVLTHKIPASLSNFCESQGNCQCITVKNTATTSIPQYLNEINSTWESMRQACVNSCPKTARATSTSFKK